MSSERPCDSGTGSPGRPGALAYDLAIAGSGGAAFSAAIAARRADLRVLMIERGTVGGTCVNVGCIPSKALLAAAESRHRADGARFPGIRTSAGPVGFGELIAAKDTLVETMRREKYLDIAAAHGIEIVKGDARFLDGPIVGVEGRRITAAHYLLATGAEPVVPDVPGLRESGHLTSTTAMELDHLPASLIIIGGGSVGMEQAQLFARLGARVTMVVRSTLARGEEPEIAAELKGAFAADGIVVREGTGVTAVRREDRAILVSTDRGEDLRAEQILVATGRRPLTEGLGLDAIGVRVGAAGEVLVDEHLRTSHPRVWAAGDVTGHPQFVYVAARQGALVVANAFEQAERRISYRSLPRITFTDPTLASAGLTEEQARGQGIDAESRVLKIAGVSRAIVSRDTLGVVKLVAERTTGRIVGVHMLAHGAGDAILAGVYAIDAGLTVSDLAASWNPYLTIGEALHLAAQAFTRDVGALSCCAA